MLRTLTSIGCATRRLGTFFNRSGNISLGHSHFSRVDQCRRQYCLDLKSKGFAFNSSNLGNQEKKRDEPEERNKSWSIYNWLLIGVGIANILTDTAAAADEKEGDSSVEFEDGIGTKVSRENFRTIKNTLSKDSALLHTLEFEFELTEKELDELSEAIKDNTELGYIEWHKEQRRYRGLDVIENKLITNNKNYKYYPSDYVHGLLANHAYTTSKEGSPITLSSDVDKYLENWRIVRVFNDTNKSGYYGAIYVNDKTHQVVLANRGTEEIIEGLFKKNSDWKTNFEEILGTQIIVGQQARNLQATAEAIEIAKKAGYRLSFTGHSLGAWLAELSAYYSYAYFDYRSVKAVTFDSPGSAPMMNALQSNIQSNDAQIRLHSIDIVTYLAQPNPANCCNEHVGRVYRVSPKMELTEKVNNSRSKVVRKVVGNKIRGVFSVEGHFFKGILETFDPETGKPRECKIMLDWPKVEYVGTASFSDHAKEIGKKAIGSSSLSTATQIALDLALNHIIGDRTIMTVVGFLESYATGKIKTQQYWAYFEHIDLDKENKAGTQIFDFDKRFALITLAKYREGRDTHLMGLATGSVDKYLYKLDEHREMLKANKDLPEVVKRQLVELLGSFRVEKNGQDYNLVPNSGYSVEGIREKTQRLLDVMPKGVRRVWRIKQSMDGIPNEKVTFSDNLRRISSYTAIRDKEEELKGELNKEQVVLISGARGMGKSALATDYGNQLKKNGWKVRWLNGMQIDTQFYQLLIDLGGNKSNINMRPEAVRDEVYQKLEALSKDQQILLILDDVKDKEKIQQYLTNLPNCVKVIITALDGNILDGVKPIVMNGFQEQEAIDYLRKALGNSEAEAKQIVATVGKSPFRLSKTIAYLKTNSLGDNYVESYKAIKKGQGQNEEIYPEVEMLFKDLMTTSPESWQLLKYMAYLDAEGISAELARNVMGVTVQELQRYVNTLRSLSLLDVVNDGNQKTLRVSHRIIQEEAKTALLKEDQMQGSKILEKLVSEVDKVFPDIDDSSQNSVEITRLIIHAKTLIQETYGLDVMITGKESLLEKIGSYYYDVVFDYQETIRYRQELLRYQKLIYKGDDPKVAKSLDRLGISHDALETESDIQEGLKYLKQSLRMREALFSGDHSDTAESLHNVGIAYIKLGGNKNLQKGFNFTKKALDMRQNLLSSHYPSIADALSKGVYYAVGKDENLQRELKDLADSLNSFGISHSSLGGTDGPRLALVYQRKSLGILRKLFSGNNMEVATVLMDVGSAYYALKDEAQGLKHLKESVAMQKALFPGNHPYIVDARNNRGRIYIDLGGSNNIRKGIIDLEKSLKMAKELYADNHPAVGNALHSLAIGYKALGDENKALEYFKQSYGIYSNKFRQDYEKTKQLITEIKSIEPKFFERKTSSQDCFAGNALGTECRWNITSRGDVKDHLLVIKQKIQVSALDNISQVVDKYGWSSVGLGGDWGVKGYLDESYLATKVGNNAEDIEIAKMLSFESMNLGIMKSEKKPYDGVQSFTRENPELVKKIAIVHPEFFVDGSIVEACIKAMPSDDVFREHILKHVKYLGIEKRSNQEGHIS